MNPTGRYTVVAIGLHWLLALMIFIGFGVGQYMTDLAMSPTKLKLFSWHKWLGVTVFAMVVLRVGWRMLNPPPALPATTPAWQRRVAAGTHLLLYLLMLAIPLSGWLYSSASGFQTVYFGRWPLPDLLGRDAELAAVLKTVHVSLNNGLAVLVLAHIGAALKHHFIDHDGLLWRMWPGRRRSLEVSP